MIIYRCLTIHYEGQQLVSLLSESHNLLAIFDYCIKDWAKFFFKLVGNIYIWWQYDSALS